MINIYERRVSKQSDMSIYEGALLGIVIKKNKQY